MKVYVVVREQTCSGWKPPWADYTNIASYTSDEQALAHCDRLNKLRSDLLVLRSSGSPDVAYKRVRMKAEMQSLDRWIRRVTQVDLYSLNYKVEELELFRRLDEYLEHAR